MTNPPSDSWRGAPSTMLPLDWQDFFAGVVGASFVALVAAVMIAGTAFQQGVDGAVVLIVTAIIGGYFMGTNRAVAKARRKQTEYEVTGDKVSMRVGKRIWIRSRVDVRTVEVVRSHGEFFSVYILPVKSLSPMQRLRIRSYVLGERFSPWPVELGAAHHLPMPIVFRDLTKEAAAAVATMLKTPAGQQNHLPEDVDDPHRFDGGQV